MLADMVRGTISRCLIR